MQPVFIGVNNEAEAAGNLIDCLDAAGADADGVVFVNVAPRDNNGYTNGVPFCCVWVSTNGVPFSSIWHGGVGVAVLTVLSPVVLGLLNKFGLASTYQLLDISSITAWGVEQGLTTRAEADLMCHTQFRSYEFLPWMAALVKPWIATPIETGQAYPYDQLQLPTPGEPIVWWIDNFGNAKTSALPKDIGFGEAEIDTVVGKLKCYPRLVDVPHGEPGLVIGSSGIGDQRLLEVVIRGGRASDVFGLKTGQPLLKKK